MAYENVTSFDQCVSDAERSQRLKVSVVNAVIWLLLVIGVVASMGTLLLIVAFGWVLNLLLSEYNVRCIQAVGATASPAQFPEVHRAAQDVCARFGVKELPRIVVLPSGEMNALAVKFARKKVVVVLSELLAGVVDDPARLRFLLAHEICHHALDHGRRGTFELAKSARYRQARELTCDNAGLAAAGEAGAARDVVKMLCVGRHLFDRLDEAALVAESQHIYSGLTGWFVRNYLSHPPAGARLENVARFHEACGGAPAAGAMPGLAAG